MRKRKLGYSGSLSVLFSIALALFNLGIFGLLLLSGNEVSRRLKENFEVQIYMSNDADSAALQGFRNFLKQRPYLSTAQGEDNIRFTSKEEAAEKFIKETGEDFSQFLGENPLRNAYSIRIAEPYLQSDSLLKIKKDLQAQPHVFEAVYLESLVGDVHNNLARISLLFVGIAILLTFAVIWLIRNTVRISVYAKRFLIRSMVLVGAEPWFIQKPYLLNGLWQGFLGAFLASSALLVSLHYALHYFPPLRSVVVPEQLFLLVLFLFLSGMLLSGISAFLSVRRFISQRLDQLHHY